MTAAGIGSRASSFRAGLELVVFLSLLELFLWMGEGRYRTVVGAGAVVGVLIVMGISLWRGTPQGMFPPRRSSLPRAWMQAGVITVACALALIAGGRLMRWWVGGMQFDFAALTAWGAVGWFAGKLVVIAGQQLALQLILLPRAFELTGRRSAALALSGAVFGVMHLPNLLLVALTAAIGPIWCALYLRSRRLLPLILSHLVLAVVARAACGDAIYNLRVGSAVLPLLPRTVVAGDGSELRVVPRAIEGFLDQCTMQGDTAVCSGWAADLDRREPAAEIVLLAAGTLHRYPATRRPRPDVTAEFGLPGIENCGFQIELPAAWLAAPEEVRFFATSTGGTSSELAYLWPTPLPSPPPR